MFRSGNLFLGAELKSNVDESIRNAERPESRPWNAQGPAARMAMQLDTRASRKHSSLGAR